MTCGLIYGRHHLPDDVSDYVFSADIPVESICDADYMENVCSDFINKHNPDKIEVYVTGFTPALLALIKVCVSRNIGLSAYNYDRVSRKFWKQEVL